MHIPPLRSLLASSLTVLVVAASATACGSDPDEGADGEPTSSASATPTDSSSESGEPTETESATTSGTLTAEQVEQALITEDNLGDGWLRDPEDDEDEEDEEDAPGCIGEIGRLTRSLDKVEEAEASFSFGAQGLPQVNSGVKTYADETALSDLFDQFQDEIAGCDSISFDNDGTSAELTLTPVSDLSGVAVDDQANLVAAGQLTTASGQTSPIYIYFSYVRVGSSIGVTGTTSLSEVTTAHESWAAIGANRLAAVAAGQEPEVTTAPQP